MNTPLLELTPEQFKLAEEAGLRDLIFNKTSEYAQKLAKFASLLQANSGWISVEDRLPEDESVCLVIYCEGGKYQFSLAWYYRTVDEWLEAEINSPMRDRFKPTHWMSLPAAPK